MVKKIVPGVIVRHITFGEGTVVSINNDVADVNFLNFGKKTVLLTYLKIVDSEIESFDHAKSTEIKAEIKITSLLVVKYIIEFMSKNKMTKMKTNQCVNLIREHFGKEIPADFILQSVDPVFDLILYKNLIEREKRLSISKTDNKVLVIKSNSNDVGIKFAEINDIDDFERACMKEKFDTTVKLFFAREIIRFASNIKKPDAVNVLYLKNICESLLNVFLRQMSINHFYNDVDRKNPSFYAPIFGFIQDNKLSEYQKEESLKMISTYLTRMIINQFLIVNGARSSKIYLLDKNNNLLFGPQFIKLLNKKGKSLDRRIVNRIKYFMSKNNDYSSQLQHYVDFLGKDEAPTKEIILKFEYENNLNNLSKELIEDLILKSDFKALMKKYGIPTNENYFKMCMARIDYTLRSKKLILRNKYKTITAYYREQALKGDIYRYSNPYNLDEYDLIIRNLMLNLDLIDVGYGVYITRTNMVKNGITDEVIKKFQKRVVEIVNKTRFISLREVMDFMKDDKVIQYCDGDKKQLIQFVKPISDLGINELSSGSFILCVKSSKHYKGDFIEFIFGKAISMDVYDIHDLVLEHFDVEYSIEEIVRDLKHTNLYYSEEMEKVYKDKQAFIMEVFGNGD